MFCCLMVLLDVLVVKHVFLPALVLMPRKVAMVNGDTWIRNEIRGKSEIMTSQ